MRLDADLDLRPALDAKQSHFPVDEAGKALHPIQDGLNL
jgi:hypothetical protein